ncbi:MAG: hypothetical protein R3A13_12470 [Bdellovibrionota bacterium]
MLDYNTNDAVVVFEVSSDLKSAIKNFIKREAGKGDPGGKLAKNLYEVFNSGDKSRIDNFLNKHKTENATYLYAIGGYAHLEFITIISENIVDNYAEAFNETYESDGKVCKVTDDKEFKKIAVAALKEIDEAIDNAELPDNPFMKNVVYNAIFEIAVLKKVFEVCS